MRNYLYFILTLITLNINAQTIFIEHEEDIPFLIDVNDIATSDIDGDNDIDLLIQGWGIAPNRMELYTNEGLGNFNLQPNSILTTTELSTGDLEFADLNGDGSPDLFAIGMIEISFDYIPHTNMYFNDGDGNFSLIQTSMPDVQAGSITIGDIDNDDDLDIYYSGRLLNTGSGTNRYAGLWLNDGNGNFTELENPPFPNDSGESELIDIDGDNDLDLIITADNDGDTALIYLYKNDGNGSFSEFPDFGIFDSFRNPSYILGDVDGDNDPDMLFCAWTLPSDDAYTTLFLNNGEGTFTESSNFSVTTDVANAPGMKFGDLDMDGDLDFAIAGWTGEYSNGSNIINPVSIYFNDGNGNFTETENNLFPENLGAKLDLADVDGDNDLDIIVIGQTYSGVYINQLDPVTTSVENISSLANKESNFSVYPNITNQSLVFIRHKSDYSNTPIIIKVSDSEGQIIVSKQTQIANQTDIPLDITNLKAGVYFIHLFEKIN